MAQPTVLPGTKLLILVSDGGSPPVFSQPCGLTSNGINFSAQTNSTLVPDCDDPEAPAWEAKDINSLACEVTGSGVMALESLTTWLNWFTAAEARACKIKIDDVDGGEFDGDFVLTGLKYGGQRGQKITLDVTLQNTGAIVFTPA